MNQHQTDSQQKPVMTAIIIQSSRTQIHCISDNMIDIAAFLALAPAGNHHALVLTNEDGTKASTIVNKPSQQQVSFIEMKAKSDAEVNVFREVFDQLVSCHLFNQPLIEHGRIEVPAKGGHHGSVHSGSKHPYSRRVHS